MSLAKLAIRGKGPLGIDTTVELDGRPVPGLRSLWLDIDAAGDEINTVTLKIEVDEVHVDAEVLAALQALVDRQESGG